MSSTEERLASLEARVDSMVDLRGEVHELRVDMNRQCSEFRADMNRQFAELRADMNQRFAHADLRIDTIDAKSDRHFTWLAGIQVALLLAVIGAMIGAYYR